jgi:hypothetical protein
LLRFSLHCAGVKLLEIQVVIRVVSRGHTSCDCEFWFGSKVPFGLCTFSLRGLGRCDCRLRLGGEFQAFRFAVGDTHDVLRGLLVVYEGRRNEVMHALAM